MDINNINWYPGHMKKAIDKIKENMKLVDIVLVLVDSRIVKSSMNPVIEDILKDKPQLILLNKMDMADPKITQNWINYFAKKNITALPIDSKNGKNLDKIEPTTKKILEDVLSSRKDKNIKSEIIRMMIVGIPNVGKSTIINKLSNRQSAKTGNTPGVTRTNQWIRIKGKMELLDTPGVLWPKFEDNEIGLNLAFTGAIKDEILDEENLAYKLIEKLMSIDPQILEKRYSVDTQNKETIEIMDDIAIRRGCLLKGKNIDYSKVSSIIIDEFRKTKLGRISLEDVCD
ncbi:ribosome biogenesis GTPase YlqF [Finegoldia magna]|uniref:Ribosome biogenesis GTPase A n=1 Tax=Finegoldia magna (strain ATCC 29328 / DSM 20472 / WAL 2508) TaxID=334413 RepID=B0S049_FINM2|nr:ribosome biogenesis GTPase YlqF [Finegoldia magna]EXF27174.1 GTPase [Finegoldia magna ALB8]MDU1213989.1 ribosome biogenesis GTPase YlqF [Finegoldia magna]MDU5442826.1 ribosome biogenesis GTPase YlqF [Finegoldia magna]MDU5526766.1 ribosome biogenesis GTPase YlqF [Finegoldia magna]MDU7033308.1 ribosome biogenesis GTPase YlqF [Finegoldia magna]